MTGYTSRIDNKTTLREFALDCACAFIHDCTRLPEKFERHGWHDEQLKQAKERLASLRRVSLAEAQRRADEDFARTSKAHEEMRAGRQETIDRFARMLKLVRAWKAPSRAHQKGLKRFMIQQLTSSIEFERPTAFDSEPEKLTGREWLKRERQRAAHDVRYHSREAKKEARRIDRSNEWLRLLRSSLT